MSDKVRPMRTERALPSILPLIIKESPQAFGSAGGYPLTCHQATDMLGERTRPRLLHVRYKRIEMYG